MCNSFVMTGLGVELFLTIVGRADLGEVVEASRDRFGDVAGAVQRHSVCCSGRPWAEKNQASVSPNIQVFSQQEPQGRGCSLREGNQ